MGRIRTALRSVRVRLLAAIVLVAALGLIVAGGATYAIQRDRAITRIDQRLDTEVENLRAIAAGTPGSPAPTTVGSLLYAAMQGIIPQPDESTLGVVGGEPAYLPAVRLPFRITEHPTLLKRMIAEADGADVVRGTAVTEVGTLRYVVVPVAVAGDTNTGLYLAAIDVDPTFDELGQSFATYALIALLALAALALAGWFIAGRALRPVRLLQETAARASERDLSERVPVEGNDDLSELARTVNGMLDRLEGAFAAQHRLLDDVGHELRTPLTIVRGHLELMRPADADDVESTRELTLDELDRMAGLVDDLSLLTRSEEPAFLAPEPVDLGVLTESVFAKAKALSSEHQWMSEPAVEHAVLSADPRRLTEAWLQLAENAVKYSPAGTVIELGSTVVVGVRAVAGSGVASGGAAVVRLWVSDAGPGIPENQRDRVFERFARAVDGNGDPGRGPAGSGLGLSIVRAIAVAHGGRARMEVSPTGGTRAVIEVPMTGAAERSADAPHPAR